MALSQLTFHHSKTGLIAPLLHALYNHRRRQRRRCRYRRHRDAFRRRRRARLSNAATYQRSVSDHLTAIFYTPHHLHPHPVFKIHSLNRAVFPSSTPAAYHRLSRSVRCCCLSAGRQQWQLTARSLSPISSAARAQLSHIPTQPSSTRSLRQRLRMAVR
jgi:hypothetical protein